MRTRVVLYKKDWIKRPKTDVYSLKMTAKLDKVMFSRRWAKPAGPSFVKVDGTVCKHAPYQCESYRTCLLKCSCQINARKIRSTQWKEHL